MGKMMSIFLTLTLVMLMVMVSGCAQSPQTAKYPANLSGRVTISEKMKSPNVPVAVSAGQGWVFWIVQISVKNVSYSNPITDHSAGRSWFNDWRIVANNAGSNVPWQYDVLSDFSPGSFNIASGQSGQLTMVFIVQGTTALEDAQICYVGQDPSSFGKLTEVKTVEAYDWASKTAIAVTPAPAIETYLVHGASVIDVFRYMQLKTTASWQGTSSKTMSFTATQVPCIINYGWTATSAITSNVDVYALDKNNISPLPFESQGTWTMELDVAGKYTIQVDAVGAQWWLKIGVEQ
jgi:hypothetical protein